jgi:hypothetical protein
MNDPGNSTEPWNVLPYSHGRFGEGSRLRQARNEATRDSALVEVT